MIRKEVESNDYNLLNPSVHPGAAGEVEEVGGAFGGYIRDDRFL